MQNVAGRGDGIAAEEEGTSRFFRSGYKTQSRGPVSVNVGINAFLGISCFDMIGRYRGVDISAVVVTVGHDFDIRFENRRFFRKFILQQVFGLFKRTSEQPTDKAEGKHVFAP